MLNLWFRFIEWASGVKLPRYEWRTWPELGQKLTGILPCHDGTEVWVLPGKDGVLHLRHPERGHSEVRLDFALAKAERWRKGNGWPSDYGQRSWALVASFLNPYRYTDTGHPDLDQLFPRAEEKRLQKAILWTVWFQVRKLLDMLASAVAPDLVPVVHNWTQEPLPGGGYYYRRSDGEVCEPEVGATVRLFGGPVIWTENHRSNDLAGISRSR